MFSLLNGFFTKKGCVLSDSINHLDAITIIFHRSCCLISRPLDPHMKGIEKERTFALWFHSIKGVLHLACAIDDISGLVHFAQQVLIPCLAL